MKASLTLAVLSHENCADLLACLVHERPRLINAFVRQFEHGIRHVRVYGEALEVWHGGQFIERIPRLRGSGRHHIQYRRIIDSLVRKPGAFAHYRYQSDLFPGVLFRVAYDYLREHDPAGADREYVQILHLAASESEISQARSI